MKAELVLFGKRLNMASQASRRRLVVLVYCAFAVLIAAGWFFDHWIPWTSTFAIFVASYVGRLILGGYGFAGKGLIKPFLGNEARARYVRDPSGLWSRMARQTVPNIANDREFLSDEREVDRRNSAHEKAYRSLGVIVIATLVVACLKNSAKWVFRPIGLDLSVDTLAFFDSLIYYLLLTSFVLFLTLPQAILLWTEPDMENPDES